MRQRWNYTLLDAAYNYLQKRKTFASFGQPKRLIACYCIGPYLGPIAMMAIIVMSMFMKSRQSGSSTYTSNT